MPETKEATKTSVAPSARGSEVKVDVQDVSMFFGQNHVLDQIKLEVRAGEFVALLGASGCGKTTLLNLVAGFLEPSRGQVVVDGGVVRHPGADRTMVFQDDAVFPWYTVRRNVEYSLRVHGVSKRERVRRSEDVIQLVGLTGREDAYPHELSGGMRKRVDVARALVTEPGVVLMDEPFAALDVMTKTRLQNEFLRLWEAHKITVLFVTHDIEEALFMSDRVVVMSSHPGRVIRDVVSPFPRPRSEELRTSPEFQELRHSIARQFDAELNVEEVPSEGSGAQ